jgi:hypothetical protein
MASADALRAPIEPPNPPAAKTAPDCKTVLRLMLIESLPFKNCACSRISLVGRYVGVSIVDSDRPRLSGWPI